VREYHSETITRFVWGLRPKIKHDIITCPYNLNTVEEAFDVVVRLNLTFKILVNVKVRCFKFKGYRHYDYQCPSESQHVKTVPIEDVDDSKVIEEVHIPSKTLSIIEYTSVCTDTLVNDEIHMSSDSASNDVDEIVESNTPLRLVSHSNPLVLNIVL